MNATELEGAYYPIAEEDGNGTASVFPMYEDGGGESISVPVVTSTPVFILAVTGVVLALLLVSLASTLSVLCSVCFCCAPGSGRIGYFHIVAAFCVINSAYFLGKGAMWAVTSARVLVRADNESMIIFPEVEQYICVGGCFLLGIAEMFWRFIYFSNIIQFSYFRSSFLRRRKSPAPASAACSATS